MPQGFDECWRQRAVLFPHFPWDKPDQGAATHCHFRAKIPEDPGVKLKYPRLTFAALHWYWSNLRWLAQPLPEPFFNDVTWVELAIDFQCATRIPLAGDGEDDDDEDILKKAELFKKMTFQMARCCAGSASNFGPRVQRPTRVGFLAYSLYKAGFIA